MLPEPNGFAAPAGSRRKNNWIGGRGDDRKTGQKKPDFDPRNYGFLKLTPLMKSLDKYFQIEEREVENKRIKHIYVKNI